MGACITKGSIKSGTTTKKKSGSHSYGVPSIEDLYQQNKAEMRAKKNQRSKTSAFELPFMDAIK